jgi:hypothetical protein
MKVKFYLLILFAILFVCNLTSAAITGSIGNARMVLYPKVGFWGTTIQKEILVQNVNDQSIDIRLEVSENLSKIVEIIDKEFTLQAGQEKNARFKIKLKRPGDYEGKITVFFEPPEGKGTGIALSSTIIIHATGNSASEDDGSENDGENVRVSVGSGSDNSEEITGNGVENGGFSSKIILLAVSPIVLAIVLIFLLIKLSKRKKRVRGDRRKL